MLEGLEEKELESWLHNEEILLKSPDPSPIPPNSVPFSSFKFTPEA